MIKTRHLLASLSCGALLLAGSATGAELTWPGGNGNWSDAGAWSGSTWSANDSALLNGGTSVLTLTENIDITNLTHGDTASGNHTISGFNLNFAAGGNIDVAAEDRVLTITSGITGAPTVGIADGAHNPHNAVVFAPEAGKTQTLGAITSPYNDADGGDKGYIRLGGTTTGNTVESITYPGGIGGSLRYGVFDKDGSGTWTVTGDLWAGRLWIGEGELNVGGTLASAYVNIEVGRGSNGFGDGSVLTGTGTLSGNFTMFNNDRRSQGIVNAGATIAPGNSIGTVTIEYGTGGGSPTPSRSDYSLWFKDGSFYEWEVGAGNTTDTIHITEGGLFVDDMTLKIIALGGSPSGGDQLAVFTYDPGVVIDLSLFQGSFDTTGAPDWDASAASLIDDGNGTVYLTGLVPEPSSLALLGLGGLLIARRRRG